MRILYVYSLAIPSREANSVHVMRMCDVLCEFLIRVVSQLPPRNAEKVWWPDVALRSIRAIARRRA